jgi:X-Pro dipeptidyl-peptidase (S15 family)
MAGTTGLEPATSAVTAIQFDALIGTCLEYEFPQFANKEVSMPNIPSSGIEPGQRRLNGPQTTGRDYRNLSQPIHAMANHDDVAVPMRDGVTLLADVHRPAEPGCYPVLVAASPYPRQIQNLGAPAGFIEAGASDFFVPRGYVHVIANCRGTSGSGGTRTAKPQSLVSKFCSNSTMIPTLGMISGAPSLLSIHYAMTGGRTAIYFR